MKTAKEWVATDSGHFDEQCEDCLRIISEIQADAIEAAAAECVSDEPDECARAIRKLKETL